MPELFTAWSRQSCKLTVHHHDVLHLGLTGQQVHGRAAVDVERVGLGQLLRLHAAHDCGPRRQLLPAQAVEQVSLGSWHGASDADHLT